MQSKTAHGTPRCGAKTRSGRPCKNAPMLNGRCRMHGGKSPVGIGSPRYRHGRYSRYAPASLLPVMADALAAEDDEAARQTIRAGASPEGGTDTPCKPSYPMVAVEDALNADDFDTAKRLLQELYGEGGELYHPPVVRETIRDVCREWRSGDFAPRQSKAVGSVKLVWTELPSGGWRPWFACPDCGRRCTLLFHSRCRRCEGIRYESQYSTSDGVEQLRVKAKAIRTKLHGYQRDLFDGVPQRPRRMRRATYAKLLDELQAVEVAAAKVLAEDAPSFVAKVRERFKLARDYEAFRDKHPGW